MTTQLYSLCLSSVQAIKKIQRTYLHLIIIVLMISGTNASSQTQWVKYESNPVLDLGPAGSWDDQAASIGSVLFDGKEYHMWYGGNDGNVFRIGHATSYDGISWIKDVQNPVVDTGTPGSFDDSRVYGPCVLYHNSTYHMWYVANDGYFERVGHATSPDGSVWTKDPMNPVLDVGSSGSWDDLQVFPMAASVLFIDGMYHMYYGGVTLITGRYYMGHATSADGSNWIKDPLNPVMGAGEVGEWDSHSVIPGTIIYDGSMFHIWYSGCASDYRWRIGYAVSTDGINWAKDNDHNPVLDFGSPGNWDHLRVWNGMVLYDNGSSIYKMWYVGGEFDADRTGYAIDDHLVGLGGDLNTQNSDHRISFMSYPNPFSANITLSFEIKQPSTTEITIHNHLGKKVEQMTVRNCSPGHHKITWNVSHLPDGIYFIRLQAGQVAASEKVVKMK